MSQPIWIILIISGYLLIWLGLSYVTSRGADNATFFSGNRKMAWPLVAIAMIGAPITGVTFLSVPGMVIHKGYSYLQMGIGFILGYLLIAFVLIPVYYKLKIVSVYEFLQNRFGRVSYKTGAWLFFVSKILGISIRFLMVCLMLQLLLLDPLGIPFIFSVIIGLAMVWLSTFKGGVKSVIWGDTLKSICLVSTILLCLYFLMNKLHISFWNLPAQISLHETSKVFFLDNPSDGKYFWKQVIAGIFIVVAMTGLDQDMMQRTLACKNARDAKKNLITSSFMQVVVIFLLLVLGSLMVMFMDAKGLAVPEKSDNLFATVAFHEDIPIIVGCLFVLGIVSATCSSVGSALTAMTTTVTVDLMEADKTEKDNLLVSKRKRIHTYISLLIAVIVVGFYYINNDDALSTVYTLISFTDGPILGLFLFGILTKKQVYDKWLPVICIMAPVVSWVIQWATRNYLDYEISFELLIINAGITFLSMLFLAGFSRRIATVAVVGDPDLPR